MELVYLKSMKDQIKKLWLLFLVISLTLGLAPHKSPHIIGKIQWIAGGYAFSGNNSMNFMDWIDVFIHGSPWLLLIISTILNAITIVRKPR